MLYYCENCDELLDEDEVRFIEGRNFSEYWGSFVAEDVEECFCGYCGEPVEMYGYSREIFEETKAESALDFKEICYG